MTEIRTTKLFTLFTAPHASRHNPSASEPAWFRAATTAKKFQEEE